MKNSVKNRLLSLLLFVLTLTGCSKNERPIAYSFSCLFEKEGNEYIATAYCKKNTDEGLSEIIIEAKGDSLINALINTDKKDYDLFFGSNRAILFSSNVSDNDKIELITFILNTGKYHSKSMIYTGNQDLESIAKEVEALEYIRESQKIQFAEFTDYVKEISIIENNN